MALRCLVVSSAGDGEACNRTRLSLRPSLRPVSEEAEVADLDEAWWQNVKQETPDKLDCVYRHNLLIVAVG
jgi:hypothetical protein